MNADEFMQQFGGKPYELVVRISWCWDQKSGSFPQMGNLYHARARFDQALDLRTNELVGRSLYNWLEWLTPKHLLGHPYGFAFKEGRLYRLLVREQTSHTEGIERSYYVEQLLESDVTEPRLDPLLQFASDYRSEEVERYLLIEDDAFGWANVFGYRRAAVRYLAIASDASDEPRACMGRIMWMEKASGSSLKTKFKKLCVYKVRVREKIDDPTALMLVKVEKRVDDSRFDPIREEYLKPVKVESTLGTFELDRHYDWYEGTIDYLGAPCSVLLTVEEGSTDAQVALARLESLCADLETFDKRARECAAEELLENAIDWCEEELTSEQFANRMSNPALCVGSDGSVEFTFDDGGMFWGHVIVVSMDADGVFSGADIEG